MGDDQASMMLNSGQKTPLSQKSVEISAEWIHSKEITSVFTGI